MTSLLPPRTRRSRRSRDPEVALTATVPLDVPRAPEDRDGPSYAWALVALAGGVAAAAIGWLVVTGLAVLGWLSADPGSFGAAVAVGTQLWLLSNGAGAVLGGTTLTLTPLGLTLVWVLVVGRFARLSALHSARPTDAVPVRRAVLGVTGLTAAGYLVALLVGLLLAHLTTAPTAAATGLPERALRAVVGGLLVTVPIAARQASRVTGWRPTAAWPRWARAVPTALGLATALLLATGAAALTSSLLLHTDRVQELWRALDAGVLGGIVLLLVQCAYLPVGVLWSTAYTLGSGFGLGAGSIVAPRATDLGLLPSLPVLGALPAEGAGSPWQLAWLAGGVLAGAVAAVVVVRRGDVRRPDLGALAGGLVGGAAGVIAVGLAWLGRGGWGTGRLADLGPELLPLLIIAPVTLGLAGTVAGLFAGLVPLLRQRYGSGRSDRLANRDG